MRTRLLPLLAVLVGGSTAAAAPAEDPCASDLKRLCPEVKPGSGRVVACLREHRSDLSAACRERTEAHERKVRSIVEAFGKACGKDVDRFCRAVEPGRGRVLVCLEEHQLDLSSPCQAKLQEFADARERVNTVRKACTADLNRLCQGVPQQAGPILECLQANAESLSPECNAVDIKHAVEAAATVDTIDQLARGERIKDALEILQGIESVAFTRSQLLIQLDSYQSLAGQGNAFRLLFNPQVVFGPSQQLAFQVKVPVSALFPTTIAGPAQLGLGPVTTALAWNFLAYGQMRHYLSLGLQWPTSSLPFPIGAAWALQPGYAIAVGLARWVSLTAQVIWLRSLGATGRYPEINFLVLEPILVGNLPGRVFTALDTKLGWNLAAGGFVPLMKGVVGIYPGRERSLSLSAWYQTSLKTAAISQSFKYEVGLGLAYFFDW